MVVRLRFELRNILGGYPSIFFPLYCLKQTNKRIAVRPTSDLLIEGFPRSGNTFAVAAFLYAQKTGIHIGRHLHVQAQIYRALKWNVPVMILIRNPEDAVLSYVIRYKRLSLSQGFRFYENFYMSLLGIRERIFIVKFEDLIDNFGKIIEAFNQRFKTSFVPFEQTPENLARVAEIVEKMDRQNTGKSLISENLVARPSPLREIQKKELFKQLKNDETQKLLIKARKTYDRFLSPA